MVAYDDKRAPRYGRDCVRAWAIYPYSDTDGTAAAVVRGTLTYACDVARTLGHTPGETCEVREVIASLLPATHINAYADTVIELKEAREELKEAREEAERQERLGDALEHHEAASDALTRLRKVVTDLLCTQLMLPREAANAIVRSAEDKDARFVLKDDVAGVREIRLPCLGEFEFAWDVESSALERALASEGYTDTEIIQLRQNARKQFIESLKLPAGKLRCTNPKPGVPA